MILSLLAAVAVAGPVATKTVTLTDGAAVSVNQEKVRDLIWLRGEERVACENWTKKRTKAVGTYLREAAAEMPENPDASWGNALSGLAAHSGSEGDGWCNYSLTTINGAGLLTIEHVTCLRTAGAQVMLGVGDCDKSSTVFPVTAAELAAIGSALLD